MRITVPFLNWRITSNPLKFFMKHRVGSERELKDAVAAEIERSLSDMIDDLQKVDMGGYEIILASAISGLVGRLTEEIRTL